MEPGRLDSHHRYAKWATPGPALPTPGRRAPVRVQSVSFNNRQKGFWVGIGKQVFWYPYARLDEPAVNGNRVTSVYVDPEVGRQAFVYVLDDGRQGDVMSDQVLDYYDDPRLLRELLLHRLSVEARKRVEAGGVGKRELMRRLRTSPAQLYRLLDPTNVRKSVDQMLRLLAALNCYVDFTVKDARTK